MESLGNSILEVQNKNVRGQCFVADQDLYKVITKDAVYRPLREVIIENFNERTIYNPEPNNTYKLERYHIEQAVDIFINGAHKIFATLVHIRYAELIRQFVEDDKYRVSELDHGLPFDKDKLRALLPKKTIANEFYEQQWQFAAPVFSDSVFTRFLPPKTILPFIESLGEGGFGQVYSIEIASSHERLSSNSGHQWEVSRPYWIGMPSYW